MEKQIALTQKPDFAHNLPSWFKSYGIALIAVAVVVAIKLLLFEWIGEETPFVLFSAAVILSAYFGGKKAGIFATILAALSTQYFFLQPTGSFAIQEDYHITRFFFFLVEGGVTTWILAALQQAKQKAEKVATQLEESEARFSLFMNELPGVALIKDTQGRHLYFNKTAETLFDWQPGEWYGKTNEQLFPAEIAEQFKENDRAVLSAGKTLETIEQVVQGNSNKFYLIKKFPILDRNDYPVLLGGIGVDITERIEAENELKRSQSEIQQREKEFKALVENSPDLIARFDRSFRHLYINPVIEEVTGLSPDIFIGKTHSELGMPEEKCREWNANIDAVFLTGKEQVINFDFPSVSGTRYYQSRIVPEFNNHGVVETVLGVTRDITQQKQAELALQETLQRLNFHVDNSPLAVIEWDANFKVSRWSQQAEKIFGWTAEEVIGKHPEDWQFIVEEDREKVQQIIGQIRESEPRNACFNRNYTKAGSTVFCEWYNSGLLDENGELLSVLSLISDVSDRHKAEAIAAQATERVVHLQAVTASLSRALTPAEVAQVIVDQAISALGAVRGVVTLVADNQTDLEVVKAMGYPDETLKQWRYFAINESLPLSDVVRTQKPIFLASTEDIKTDYPRLIGSGESQALVAIPLVVETGVLGSLGLGFENPRNFCEKDRGFMLALARQCAQAIERSQLYKAEQQARAQAQASEQRFRFLCESIPQIVWTANPDGFTDYYNQRWFDYTGLTPEETKALGCDAVKHPEDRQQVIDAWMQASAQKAVFQVEQRFKRADGTYRWHLTRAMPMLDEQAQVVKWFGTCTDINDWKQAENALRDSNERLTLLSDTATNLLLTAHPQAFVDTLFEKLSVHLDLEVYFNYLLNDDEQTLRLHAYGGVPETIAQQLENLKFGEQVCGIVALQQEKIVLENVQSRTDKLTQLLRSLGMNAYVCHPLIASGHLIGTLSFGTSNRPKFNADELQLMQVVCNQVATAIERARLIRQLQQQTQSLVTANRMKDEFLAVLSHELRTPLNSMLGWAKLLRTRKFDEEKTNRALEIIERNAVAQAQLIEDILDVSRIIRGKLRLQLIPLNPISSIQAAIDTVHSTAEAKKIQIESYLNPSVGQVSGDPDRLQQIVWNLLSNAIKFTPEGGRIEIHLKQIQKQVIISVTDSGRGIAPDFLPYVFERFSQADSSITRSQGGLGLGLAIVRHLLESHGGTIAASSPGEGQGATFTITLPLLEETPVVETEKALAPVEQEDLSGIPPEPSQSYPLQGLQILVVDDEADTRELLAFILEQSGASVRIAASVAAALDQIQQLKPDLLISDIGMPDEDGYSFMRKIRTSEAEEENQMPAIALTAYARDEDRRQALEAGFQMHIPKPIEPKNLLEAVTNLITICLPPCEG